MIRVGYVWKYIVVLALFACLTAENVKPSKTVLEQITAPVNITKVQERSIEESFTEFYDWQDSVGIVRTGVGIKIFGPGHRGLAATHDLERGVELLEIPVTSMIYEHMPSDDPVVKKAQRTLKLNNLLAVIFYQEMHNPNTRFKPYFDILPKSYRSFPVFYTEQEMKLIKGTNQYGYIEHFKVSADKGYKQIISAIPELRNMKRQEFYLVYTHVVSRCLYLTINGIGQHAIVPMYDMTNTYPPKFAERNSVDVRFVQNGGEQKVTIVTKKKIKAGEELYDFYNLGFSNTNFLTIYGFVFHDIQEVTFKVYLNISNDDENLAKKKEILSHFNGVYIGDRYVAATVQNSSKDEDYWQLYSTARVLELTNKKHLEDIAQEFKDKKRTTVGRLSKDNELHAMSNLLNAVTGHLAKHPSTLEEDERLLKELEPYTTPRNLVQLRRDEKLGLMKIQQYCKKALTELAPK